MNGFDPEPYAKGFRDRNRKEKASIEKRVERANEEARRLAAELVKAAGVRRVVLFGSLAEGTVRNLSFDIDLAVSGGDYFRCLKITEDSEFKVDVVDYDDVSDHIKKRIDDRGILLV